MSGATTFAGDTRSGIVDRVARCGVIAVVRLPSARDIPRVASALMEGGIRALEITLTTPGACTAILELCNEFADEALVGAGSVLDLDAAERALDAGAKYLVSPISVSGLVNVAHQRDAATMIGAFTPTEMFAVHGQQSDFVKLFPADALGPVFLKGVLAPMPQLRVVPTGGITAANTGAWIRAGAVAVGAGSSLVDPALVAAHDWSGLTARARGFVNAVRETREVSA